MSGIILSLIALVTGILFFFFRKKKKPAGPTHPKPEKEPEKTSPSSQANPSPTKPNAMVYALLIAIDRYHPKRVGALSGCVSDSRAIKRYLEEHIPAKGLKLKTLYDEEATKDNIVAGFLDFLGQAGEKDTVFIHYSGHGSQERAHPSLWHLDPDHLNETIVCYDPHELLDQGATVTQMADKELGWLIHEVARKEPHIVVMMDCCHAGSGTRARKVNPDLRVRSSTGNTTVARNLSDYIFYQKDQEIRNRLEAGEEIGIPAGRHIALSACRSFELANEQTFPEGRFGVFTYNMLKTLNTTRGDISYRDLIQRVGIHTANTVSYQIPQVYSSHPEDLKKSFLRGTARRNAEYYQAIYSPSDGGWTLLAGSIQGIPEPVNGETTQLALYADDEALEKREIDKAILASVREVMPDKSKLAILPGYKAQLDTTYKAIMVSSPLPRTGIYFALESGNQQDDRLNELLTTAKKSFRENDQAGLFLEEKESLDKAEFQLITYRIGSEYRYRIARRDDDRALVQPIPADRPQNASRAIEELIHIARWDKTLKLQNPDTRIKPNDVELILLDEQDKPIELGSNELSLEYEYDPQSRSWKKPGIKMKIVNHSGRNLYVALLHLEADFSISSRFFPGEWFGLHEVKAGEEVIRRTEVNEAYIGQSDQHQSGRVIRLSVPDELLQQGITEVADHFKLIISTEEFSPYELEQGALKLATSSRSVAGPAPGKTRGGKTALNQLFRKIHTRAAGFDDEPEPDNFADWSTNQLTVRTIRPPENSRALLNKLGMEVDLPAGLEGELQLSSLDYKPAQRGIGEKIEGEILLPAFLHNSEETEVVPFTSGTRSVGAELNVLELKNVKDTSAVTAESPIRVKLPVKLEEGAFVMALATDGEIFYPVGFSGLSEEAHTALAIESLPQPADLPGGDQRSLLSGAKNTVKILFQKIKGKVFELPSGQMPPYIRQAFSGEGMDKEVQYEDNTLEISRKIESAKSVALVLHGFIGDCHSMLAGDKNQPNDLFGLLQKNYDLLLAFDYDSYNTSLEDSAAQLQNRLEMVGLNATHSHKLDIIAHATGGLVVRWMLEKMDNPPRVNKLVMTGPPNGGSILPQLKKSLQMGATLVANGLDAVGLAFPKALALLKGAQILFDRVDKFTGNKISKTMEEISEDKVSASLAGDSPFLSELNADPPADANYMVIAGDTGLIARDEEARAKVSKIIRFLGLDKLTYNVADLLLGDENDLAITHKSMSTIPGLAPENILKAKCDHYTYFETENGLNRIAEALGISE